VTGSAAPARIGRYVVRRTLGTGGMGVVYSAFDPHLDRSVAIKVLRPDVVELGSGSGTRGAERLRREAQSMAKLSHPHVVGVYEVGEHDERVFIAMELVEGLSLHDWVRETPRPWSELLRMYFQAGLGLAAAHDAGIVHRDFKPSNVLVGADRRARVLDFGLARPAVLAADPDADGVLLADDSDDVTTTVQLGAEQAAVTFPLGDGFEGGLDGATGPVVGGITGHGVVIGTPAYMAPELHAGGIADPRSDQFSYCVSLYEALYGERPFHGRTAFALADQMLEGRIAPPPLRTRVPGWLRQILVRGLAADPRDRHPSMRALLASVAFTARVMG
jgi:serine/threonine protein kinase